ncbi:MAG: hypothetical protein RSG77_22775, partial [Hafnia sp.]
MDILYVILKNTKITGANAEQNAYVVGPPSPLSFLSYADSYAYAAEKVGIELKTRWVLPIYHRVGEHSIHRGMLKREAVGFKTSEANVLAAPLRDELRMDL